MIRCPVCGHDNAAAQTVCEKCGKSLEYPENPGPEAPEQVETGLASPLPPPPESSTSGLLVTVSVLLLAAGSFAIKG